MYTPKPRRLARLCVLAIGLAAGLFLLAGPLAAHSDNTRGGSSQEDVPSESPQQEVENDIFDSPPDVIHEDADAAIAAEVSLLADETGLNESSVRESLEFQQAFSEFANKVLVRYPDAVSSIRTDPIPSRTGYIVFVDSVPEDVLTEASTLPYEVMLSGQGAIAKEEHAERSELVALALAGAGYRNHVVFYDPVKDHIQIEMQLESADPPSKEVILSVINTYIADRVHSGDLVLDGRAAEVLLSDVSLLVSYGSEPLVELQHSRGGNWLRDGNVNECTSGWSVSGPSGDGIITAAHCDGLDKFLQPGVTAYSMTFRNQVYGLGGDVEYHTTSHIELDEYYPNDSTIWDVASVKTTSTMVGNSVCAYGRASNNRTCNHTVTATNVTSTDENGVTVGKLAKATNGSIFQLGDSGGPWSVGTQAWGIHVGVSGSDALFLPGQQAQNALGVSIKTN